MNNSDKIQSSYQSNSVFGLSLAEVILIILFVILLLLASALFANESLQNCDKELRKLTKASQSEQKEGCEKLLDDIKELLEKIEHSTKDIKDWDKIVYGKIKDLQDTLRSLLERINELEKENQAMKDRLKKATKGDTTICTYTTGGNKKKSIALASVWIQKNRIILLKRNINESDTVVDFYLDPFDPDAAISVINEYILNRKATPLPDWKFGKMNDGLNALGKGYGNEYRAECRFTFDWYSEDVDVSGSRMADFERKYLKNSELSLEEVTQILARQGMHPDDFRQPFSVN